MKLAIVLTGPALVCLGIDLDKASIPPAAISTIRTFPICLGTLIVLLIILRLLRSQPRH